MAALTGPNSARLSLLERLSGVNAGLRGDMIRLQGSRDAVRLAERVLTELMRMNIGEGKEPVDEDLTSIRCACCATTPKPRSPRCCSRSRSTPAAAAILRRAGMAQNTYVHAIQSHTFVFGVGPAGTGKTYLAMAMAVVGADRASSVKRIVLTRPAVEAGEKLGFLPGDLAEKVNPYLRPLYDALHDMMDFDKAQKLIERGMIEVAPLAFMRGRTLNDCFIILDEAQNTTPRADEDVPDAPGYGSKAVDHRRRHPGRPARRACAAVSRMRSLCSAASKVSRPASSRGRRRAPSAGAAHRRRLR